MQKSVRSSSRQKQNGIKIKDQEINQKRLAAMLPSDTPYHIKNQRQEINRKHNLQQAVHESEADYVRQTE